MLISASVSASSSCSHWNLLPWIFHVLGCRSRRHQRRWIRSRSFAGNSGLHSCSKLPGRFVFYVVLRSSSKSGNGSNVHELWRRGGDAVMSRLFKNSPPLYAQASRL